MRATILPVGELEGVTEFLKRAKMDAREKLRRVMELIGIRTIEYLKQLTGEVRPPARGRTGTRFAHPGHWADVSSQLVNSYGWKVEDSGDGVTLALFNTADHARFLEMRDGFFVLRGVTDKGGPVETALRQAVAEVAPEWEVRT